jgi:hypothetical protein
MPMFQGMSIGGIAGGTSRASAAHGAVVAITNAQIDTSRRGLAVALAESLARFSNLGVGVLEADNADRDLVRRLPELRQQWGAPSTARLSRGARVVEIDVFETVNVCVVSSTLRADLPSVLERLRSALSHVVVDAPSRLGIATGLANAWVQSVDLVVVATPAAADALTRTRRFVEQLSSMPYTRHLDVQVVVCGAAPIGRRSRAQTERRLTTLRPIAHVPALWGTGAQHADACDSDGLRALTAYVLNGSRSGDSTA